jgi:hypothetical protein
MTSRSKNRRLRPWRELRAASGESEPCCNGKNTATVPQQGSRRAWKRHLSAKSAAAGKSGNLDCFSPHSLSRGAKGWVC